MDHFKPNSMIFYKKMSPALVQDLVQVLVLDLDQDLVQDDIFFDKNYGIWFELVHMAPYELILRLDGALWLTIISKTLSTPRRAMNSQIDKKLIFFSKEAYHQGSKPTSDVLDLRRRLPAQRRSLQALW